MTEHTPAVALEARDLCVALGGRAVVAGVGFELRAGEVVGLIGPNGAGKSTLMRALAGRLPHDGALAIDGAPAAGLSARDRARRIAYLPQERDIAWPVSVETLVSLGRTPWRGLTSGLTAEDRRAVDAAIARMELEAFRHRPATELSGGERARALIARALAQGAPLLIADEPTAGLDPAHQLGLLERFRERAREGGAVLASLHDLGLAARWCDRLIVLDRGRIVADGAPSAVLTPSLLATVYGVSAFFAEDEGGPIVAPTGVLRAR